VLPPVHCPTGAPSDLRATPDACLIPPPCHTDVGDEAGLLHEGGLDKKLCGICGFKVSRPTRDDCGTP